MTLYYVKINMKKWSGGKEWRMTFWSREAKCLFLATETGDRNVRKCLPSFFPSRGAAENAIAASENYEQEHDMPWGDWEYKIFRGHMVERR